MPTTLNGTAYTVVTSTSTGYGTSVLIRPDSAVSATNVPTILYAHGAGGAYNQFATLPAWQGLRDWLLDNGCAIVEGGGGVTDVIGGQNWGNTGAREAYVAYLNWADSLIDVGSVVPFGRSMGGLIAPWLYLQSSIASRCVGLIMNSGVCSMNYSVPPATANIDKSTIGFFDGTDHKLAAAYGVEPSELVAASASHDPMNFAPSLWDGKKVLQLVGTADPTVPPHSRGAYPLRALYAGRPAVDLLDVRIGGTHLQDNGSYLQVAPMTAFLADLGFGAAVEIPDPVYYECEDWLYVGGHLTKIEYQV